MSALNDDLAVRQLREGLDNAVCELRSIVSLAWSIHELSERLKPSAMVVEHLGALAEVAQQLAEAAVARAEYALEETESHAP